MVTWEQGACTTVAENMNLSTRATVENHTNNQAGQQGQHGFKRIQLVLISDETHIHDRGKILKKGLLPNHPGSTPTSYSFVDKIVFAFFPTAATMIRSLPPVQAKNLAETRLTSLEQDKLKQGHQECNAQRRIKHCATGSCA